MVRKTARKPAAPAIPVVPRSEAIAQLRSELGRFTDIETSVCKAAADRNVFCSGFKRYTDDQLRQRYSWIVAKRPEMTREELETIANDWQLAQQEVYDLPIACDVQRTVQDTCRGWNDFTNAQLAKFIFQLTGREIEVV